ncbi:signal peptidase I [Enterococcus florum]|nr:signal peptidase I [Enterococcus florum]
MLLGIGLHIYQVIYPEFMVDGDSMYPTFINEEQIKVKAHHQPKRWDVVVFQPPEESEETTYLKRIIGVPGDHIRYKDDQLYLNNIAVDDPFSENTDNFDIRRLLGIKKIPEGYYFVLGDNRGISKDSRLFGLVPEDNIIGIVAEGKDSYEENTGSD